jgi:hypothetical protein
MWATTPYQIDGSLTVYVYKDGERVASLKDVHSFETKDGVLWVAQNKGKTVCAWADHAWDMFEAGENIV